MTQFSMWAGYVDADGRSLEGPPELTDALVYRQGSTATPDAGKPLCVVLSFEEQIGPLQGSTRAEVRMSVETARMFWYKLEGLLERIDRRDLEPSDYDDAYG